MEQVKNDLTMKNINQFGFTLLEVLLSIVLLFIILTSFVGIFVQSAKFTQNNGQKLGTIQTAQMVINSIESITNVKNQLQNQHITDSNGIVISNQQPSDGTYHINGISTINALLNISVNTNYNVSLIISNFSFITPNNSTVYLIQVKVTVQDPSDPNNKSETYTYIR